jgi:hypothetical protein
MRVALIMKTTVLLSVIAPGMLCAETAIPAAFQKERYEETLATAPFAVEAVRLTAAGLREDSILDHLVLTGLGKTNDGRDFVILQQQGMPGSLRLEGNEPGPSGIAVKQVRWGDKWRSSAVVISDGTKEKALKFDENSAPRKSPPKTGGNGGPGKKPMPRRL